MFLNRRWPEGYEFPACDPCNQAGREYEPFLAMLRPLWFSKSLSPDEKKHWEKITRGVANNQPDLIRELLAQPSRNEQRKHLRRAFGDSLGDELRRRGYEMANLGPLAQAAIQRFAIKLGKALFYKHIGTALDGELWAYHFDTTRKSSGQELLDIMTRIAPLVPVTVRSGQFLDDQFTYRYNVSSGPEPLFYAVVQFNDQLMFHIIATDHRFRISVGGDMGALDQPPFASCRIDARLTTAV